MFPLTVTLERVLLNPPLHLPQIWATEEEPSANTGHILLCADPTPWGTGHSSPTTSVCTSTGALACFAMAQGPQQKAGGVNQRPLQRLVHWAALEPGPCILRAHSLDGPGLSFTRILLVPTDPSPCSSEELSKQNIVLGSDLQWQPQHGPKALRSPQVASIPAFQPP